MKTIAYRLILVVAPDHSLRGFPRASFVAAGFTLVEVTSPDRAVSVLRGIVPTGVLVDAQLLDEAAPFAGQLRSDPATLDVPIFAVADDIADPRLGAAYHFGAAVLVRPLSPEDQGSKLRAPLRAGDAAVMVRPTPAPTDRYVPLSGRRRRFAVVARPMVRMHWSCLADDENVMARDGRASTIEGVWDRGWNVERHSTLGRRLCRDDRAQSGGNLVRARLSEPHRR